VSGFSGSAAAILDFKIYGRKINRISRIQQPHSEIGLAYFRDNKVQVHGYGIARKRVSDVEVISREAQNDGLAFRRLKTELAGSALYKQPLKHLVSITVSDQSTLKHMQCMHES